MDDVEEQKCTPVRASKNANANADEAPKRTSKENSDGQVEGMKKKRTSREKESTAPESTGKDDVEEQKCRKNRTPRKKNRRNSKEKEDVPSSNRPNSKENAENDGKVKRKKFSREKEENDEQHERKRTSNEATVEESAPNRQASNIDVEEQKCTKVSKVRKSSKEPEENRRTSLEKTSEDQHKFRVKMKSKEMPTQEVDENVYAAGRVGIASDDPVVSAQNSSTTATIKDNAEIKTDSKTDKDHSPCDTMQSETPSRKAQKRKKQKKMPKEAKVDENNAVGQICGDDEISFDEKKKKKSDHKKVHKKEHTARRSKKPPKNESDDMEKPTKLKKTRSMDGSSRGHKMRSQDGSARAPKRSKRLGKHESKDNLPDKVPSFDTLMELYQRDTNVKKKWKTGKASKANEQSKRTEVSVVKKKKEKQDGFFKSIYNKAKTTITSKLNKSDDTFGANPEMALKLNDVRAEYGGPEDYGSPPEKPVDSNFDNNGKLFINGFPFWCIKDEKPPSSKHYVMTNAMRDLTEGKWILLPEAPEQKDLDPYHSMETMQARDAELFKKNKRILTNTIRSLAVLHESRQRKKKENSESSAEHPPDAKTPTREKVMSFVAPKLLIQYYRKNRLDPTHSINFTPGVMKKVRNSQRRRPGAVAAAPPPAHTQPTQQ